MERDPGVTGRPPAGASEDHPTGRLVAYIDGALPAGARDMVETHLASCASCRAERDALAGARARVAALPAEDPLRPVWPAVRARLRPAREIAFTPWFRVAAGAAAVAGFAIVLALGLGMPAPGAEETDPLAGLESSLSSSSGVAIAEPGDGETSR